MRNMEEIQMPSRHHESSLGLVEMDFSLVLFILSFPPLFLILSLFLFHHCLCVFVLFPLLPPLVLITTSSPHYGIVKAPNKQTMRHGRRQEDIAGRRTRTLALLWVVIGTGLIFLGRRVEYAACSVFALLECSMLATNLIPQHVTPLSPPLSSALLPASWLNPAAVGLQAAEAFWSRKISCLSQLCLRSLLWGRLLYLIMRVCASRTLSM